jgi:hypothetical protein
MKTDFPGNYSFIITVIVLINVAVNLTLLCMENSKFIQK